MAFPILAITPPPYYWHETDTLAAFGIVIAWLVYMLAKVWKRLRLVPFDWCVTFLAATAALALIARTSSFSTTILAIVFGLIASSVVHAVWRFRNWFQGPNRPK